MVLIIKDIILQSLQETFQVLELTPIIRRFWVRFQNCLRHLGGSGSVLVLTCIFWRFRVPFFNIFAHESGYRVPGNTRAQHWGVGGHTPQVILLQLKNPLYVFRKSQNKPAVLTLVPQQRHKAMVIGTFKNAKILLFQAYNCQKGLKYVSLFA